MNAIRSFFRRMRRRSAWMSRPAKPALAAAAVLLVGGAIWLATAGPSPNHVAVSPRPLTADELLEAQSLLDAHGIPCKSESGNLLVPSERLPQARLLLVYEGLLGRDGADLFAQLAQESDIWSTDSRNAKRWQAAKMAWLSREIGNIEGVRKATVVYEPGSPRRLGSPEVPPTAAVKIDMKPGVKVSPQLVEAAADLVAGNIPNMERGKVCIVDGTGRSYRAAEGSLATAGALERLRAAEAFYAEKIRAALPYIDNLIVGVNVSGGDSPARCTGASVAVPRSYFAGVCQAGGLEPTDENVESAIAAQTLKIRQSAAKVLGAPEDDVKVDWYYDAAPVRAGPGAPAGVSPGRGASPAGPLATAGLFAALLAGAGAWWLARTRRRAAHGDPSDALCPEPALTGRPFAFLAHAEPQTLADAVKDEHPQTIALVLSHLEPDLAAAVLGRLTREQQVDVARRIANLSPADPQTLREVERALAARMARQGALSGPGGTEALAKILQHAGYTTEQAVMAALSDSEPTLAESVRTKLFVFEDLSQVPPHRLGAALETLESDELAIALRTAGRDLTRKVLAALSNDAAGRVRQEMERIGPVRLSDVEAAQQRAVEAVRRMENGEYVSVLRGERSELMA